MISSITPLRVAMGSSQNWRQPLTFTVGLTAGDVVAIHATIKRGEAGVLGEINWDGNVWVTDSSCLVSASYQAGWNTKEFNDTVWTTATSYGTYGVAPWGTKVHGFPTGSDAEWIWTNDNINDNDIYLRWTVGTPLASAASSMMVMGYSAAFAIV